MVETLHTEADYVIVGGGLAGCALAAQLKALDPSSSVLVLEAGPDPTDKHDVVSPFGGFALAGTDLDWQYQTEPVPALENRSFTITAGKTLGGGSVLNYGGWSRGQVNDYDHWSRKINDERWSYSGLLPYMKKPERFLSRTDKSQHGFDGPFRISSVLDSDPKRRFPLCKPLQDAWSEIGTSTIENACCGELNGLSEFYENWDKGKRQPAQLAYDFSDVKVISNSPVDKILISNSTASGIQLVSGHTISSRKETIISAGTFQTPLILLRSGLTNPSIGTNYVDHFATYQLWKLKDPSRGLALGSPLLTDPAFFAGLPMDWVTNEAPPLAEIEKALDEDGVTGQQRADLLRPGRTFVETMILYTSLAPGVPVDGSFLTSSVMLTVPTSRGTVTLPSPSSTSGSDKPVIQPNYLSTAFDKLCLTYGLKRLAQLMLTTSALSTYIESEVPPPGMAPITAKSTDQEILERIVKTGMPHFHPAGTCAVGEVLDAEFRVKGVQGLRICDASVFPSHVGGHPMATVYALAEFAADVIVKGK